MSKPSPGPSPTASREKIQCGHCNASMEWRNLRSHTTRMHVGLPVLEKISKEQKTISFPTKSVKRATPENNNEVLEKRAKLDEAFIDIDEEIDDNEDKDAEVTNKDILKELLLTKDLIVNSLKVDFD